MTGLARTGVQGFCTLLTYVNQESVPALQQVLGFEVSRLPKRWPRVYVLAMQLMAMQLMAMFSTAARLVTNYFDAGPAAAAAPKPAAAAQPTFPAAAATTAQPAAPTPSVNSALPGVHHLL